MDATMVSRLMSLIPERSMRAQSGSPFTVDGSAKMELVRRFLHWLGPLESLSKDEQQLLGLRAGGGKSLVEGEDAGEEGAEESLSEELDDTAVRMPEAGTQIAA